MVFRIPRDVWPRATSHEVYMGPGRWKFTRNSLGKDEPIL
jgi:hypothetical protein